VILTRWRRSLVLGLALTFALLLLSLWAVLCFALAELDFFWAGREVPSPGVLSFTAHHPLRLRMKPLQMLAADVGAGRESDPRSTLEGSHASITPTPALRTSLVRAFTMTVRTNISHF